MSDIAVEAVELTRTFGSRKALDGVSFSVGKQEIFTLLGPNGGGKSTLFRILSTLLRPTGGGARVFGLDVVEQAHDVRARIGVVFQSPSLDKKLTVSENLRYQGYLFGLQGRPLRARIDELLNRFRLTDRAGDIVGELSGGLARRVEVAKGMLHKPALLLLDEPSTGLDPGARRDLWQQLDDCRSADGVTVLMTTHIMEEAEGSDRMILIDHGRLVAMGTAAELKSEISGEVILIEAPDSQLLYNEIAARYEVAGTVKDSTIRLERPEAHKLAGRLAVDYGDRIQSVTISKPTLEDVFLDKTGHSLWSEPEEEQT